MSSTDPLIWRFRFIMNFTHAFGAFGTSCPRIWRILPAPSLANPVHWLYMYTYIYVHICIYPCSSSTTVSAVLALRPQSTFERPRFTSARPHSLVSFARPQMCSSCLLGTPALAISVHLMFETHPLVWRFRLITAFSTRFRFIINFKHALAVTHISYTCPLLWPFRFIINLQHVPSLAIPVIICRIHAPSFGESGSS